MNLKEKTNDAQISLGFLGILFSLISLQVILVIIFNLITTDQKILIISVVVFLVTIFNIFLLLFIRRHITETLLYHLSRLQSQAQRLEEEQEGIKKNHLYLEQKMKEDWE